MEYIANLQETKKIAESFAKNAKPKDCYCLIGDLGAGKTEFARSFIQAICGEKTNISSPTFNIIQEYQAENLNVYHFDLYRIEAESELEELGLEEALEQGVCIIEWPDIALSLLPENAIKISFEILEDNKRRILIND